MVVCAVGGYEWWYVGGCWRGSVMLLVWTLSLVYFDSGV